MAGCTYDPYVRTRNSHKFVETTLTQGLSLEFVLMSKKCKMAYIFDYTPSPSPPSSPTYSPTDLDDDSKVYVEALINGERKEECRDQGREELDVMDNVFGPTPPASSRITLAKVEAALKAQDHSYYPSVQPEAPPGWMAAPPLPSTCPELPAPAQDTPEGDVEADYNPHCPSERPPFICSAFYHGVAQNAPCRSRRESTPPGLNLEYTRNPFFSPLPATDYIRTGVYRAIYVGTSTCRFCALLLKHTATPFQPDQARAYEHYPEKLAKAPCCVWMDQHAMLFYVGY